MEKACFLFGHADAPQTILPALRRAIEREIENGVGTFYVGHRGNFDRMAAAALREAKRTRPGIQLYLLLSYHPAERPVPTPEGFDGTFYPPLEDVPRRFAITQANRYMIRAVDRVVCYAVHPGNARTLREFARQSGAAVTELAAAPKSVAIDPKMRYDRKKNALR